MAGIEISNGAVSSLTDASPSLSRCKIARRVGSASAENVRMYMRDEVPTTAYTPAQKAASGDRYSGVVEKAKRVLKKAIVDDIKL